MRKMKDSGVEWIGEIGADFDLIKLKNVADILDEYRKPISADVRNQDAEVLYDYYGASGIIDKIDGYTIDDHVMLIGEDGANLLSRNLPLMYEVNGKAWINNHAHILKPKEETDFYYLFYVLESLDITMYISGSAQPKLNQESLKNIYIPMPPYHKQKAIANYIHERGRILDRVIAKQQAIIEKLKEYKLSIITEAVIRGLDKKIELKDSGNKYLGQVPIHWSVVKFGRIATIKSNLVSPVEYQDYPQISPDNIDKGSGKLLGYNTVEESGVISWNHLFYTGQIIYSKIRPLLDKVIIAPFDGLCSADMYPIETDCNKLFIVFVILSTYFHAQVALVIETRVKMPKINQNELSSIVVAIPPVKEQNQIAEYLKHKCRKVDKIIEQRGKIIETLQKYKKSIVYEMVTGKREVL